MSNTPNPGDVREWEGKLQVWNGVRWYTPDTRTEYQKGYATGAIDMRKNIFKAFETYINHHDGCRVLNEGGPEGCNCGLDKLEEYFESLTFEEWVAL